MGNSWIKDATPEEIEQVLNQNADMLSSKKGIFTNSILNLTNLLWVPFAPILLVFASCVEFDTWYGKLLGSILLNIIVLPLVAISAVIDTVVGVLSIPFALLFEGIPALFSKQYRKEFRLSRAVKKLAKVLRSSRNKISEYDAKLTLQDPKVRRLISEIKILNEQLGRNIPTSENTSVRVEAFNEFENKQEVHEELLTKKFSTLKELEKSSDKQQDNEQEF